MARIAGIDLPKDKRIEIGLTYIYGIGRKSAKDILAQTGVNQCADPQRSQEDHCQQEEVRRENQDGNCKGIRRQEGHSPPA